MECTGYGDTDNLDPISRELREEHVEKLPDVHRVVLRDHQHAQPPFRRIRTHDDLPGKLTVLPSALVLFASSWSKLRHSAHATSIE